MTINYIEKGAGLHRAIRMAGHWLQEQNGVWVSSNDAAVQSIIDGYTLDVAKTGKQAEILAFAKKLRDRAIRDISPGEMASWTIKLSEARAFAGGDADTPMLNAEAAARGITTAELVSKVQGNAVGFSALEAAISGIDGRHRDAVGALETFEAVAAYDFSTGWPEL